MRLSWWGLVASFVLVVGCSEPPRGETSCESIRVLAASSLSNAFADLERAFLAEHDCVAEVDVIFGASSSLAAQVVNGAPVDVFVSASRESMRPVLENGTVGDPVIVARNSAAVMVSVESSFVSSIGSVVDLLEKRNKGIVVGLCAASVPCGALADRVLANASLVTGDESVSRANIADTEASSAEDLVTKIQIGELDAGITYMSDCASARAGRVRCVDITADVNSTTDVVAVATSNSGIARDFVDFLVGDAARRILVDTHRFAEAT